MKLIALFCRQDELWGQELIDEMDPHYRANLIPYLRGNARSLYEATYPDDACPTAAEADEWLETTPLMRKLVAYERARDIDERRATHQRNQAYEQATGYQKVRNG